MGNVLIAPLIVESSVVTEKESSDFEKSSTMTVNEFHFNSSVIIGH